MSGWIKLHRDIRKNWIWQKADYVRSFIDLLMMANHEKRTRLYNDSLVIIERGEVVSSLAALSKRWRMTTHKTRHFLSLLEKDSIITRKTAQGFTHLSICKYDTYQNVPQTHRKSTANSPQIHRKSTATPKELKELKNVKNIYKPQQFEQIEKSLDELQSQFKNRNVKSEFQHFKDYCDANGKKYKNYLAAFRNWLRNEQYRTKDEPIKKTSITIECPNGHHKRTVNNRKVNAVCPECFEQLKPHDQIQLERAIA